MLHSFTCDMHHCQLVKRILQAIIFLSLLNTLLSGSDGASVWLQPVKQRLQTTRVVLHGLDHFTKRGFPASHPLVIGSSSFKDIPELASSGPHCLGDLSKVSLPLMTECKM